jgi:hypothetical protein
MKGKHEAVSVAGLAICHQCDSALIGWSSSETSFASHDVRYFGTRDTTNTDQYGCMAHIIHTAYSKDYKAPSYHMIECK